MNLAGSNVTFMDDFIDFYLTDRNDVHDVTVDECSIVINHSKSKNTDVSNMPSSSVNQYINLNCEIVDNNTVNQSNDEVNLTLGNNTISDNINLADGNAQTLENELYHVNSPTSNRVCDTQEDPYMQLSKFCKKNSKRMIFSHMNINSLAPKFTEIHDILVKGFSDIFFYL